MRKVISLISLLFMLPAIVQAANLEDLLVEKGLITKSEAVSASNVDGAKVYWKGGTRLDFADAGFTAKINTQVQARYEFTDYDSNSGQDNTSSFRIRRARLSISGKALHEEFSYKLQVAFLGHTLEDGSRGPDVQDAYIVWHPCPYADIKMGQFKTQLSRQYSTSSTKMQFADRSEASEYFDYGRQTGLKGMTDLMEGRVKVAAGIYNGTSDGEGRNRPGVDTNHLADISVRADLMGTMDPFEEGDLSYTENAALNAGAVYAYADAKNDIDGIFDSNETHSLSADMNFKYRGAGVHAELFYRDYEADITQVAYDNLAFYVQAGYFVDPKKVEIAARYGYIDCDNGRAAGVCAGNDAIQEVSASLNYFLWKHNLRAQLGFMHVSEEAIAGGTDLDTNKWLLQLGGYF